MTRAKPDIEVVLAHYGVDRVPAGGGWRPVRCPFHDDSHASASVNTEEGVFACHACAVRGDGWALIMHADGVSFPAALRRAEEIGAGAATTGSGVARRASGRTGRAWRPPGRRGRSTWTA